MFSAENKCCLTDDLVPTPRVRCSEVQLTHAMCCAVLHILSPLFPLQMTLNSSIQRSSVLPGLPACLPLSVSATQTKAHAGSVVLPKGGYLEQIEHHHFFKCFFRFFTKIENLYFFFPECCRFQYCMELILRHNG